VGVARDTGLSVIGSIGPLRNATMAASIFSLFGPSL